MGAPANRTGGKFTYDDYKTWPDGERWEIINGEAYNMTPAPTTRHQRISGNIFSICHGFFRGKVCIPFDAPTDVVLDEYNVVQPDIFVVCDRSKITEANIKGVPDLVIEILSPSTGLKDKREKKGLYERFGVREYIVVDPEREMVERHRLVGGEYKSPNIFNWDETLVSSTFPELEFPLWEVFERELSPEEGSAFSG